MAIFTSAADKNISLLTWACQVDKDNTEELAWLLYTFGKRKPYHSQFSAFERSLKLSADELKDFRTKTQHVTSEQKEWIAIRTQAELSLLPTICDIAYLSMKGIGLNGGIPRDLLQMICQYTAHLASNKPSRYTVDPHPSVEEPNEIDLIPASAVHFVQGSNSANPADEVALAILLELQAIFPNKVTLVRLCEDCRAPFVRHEHRPEQQYCSHRCAARSSERRRYSARKQNTTLPAEQGV